MHPASMHVSAGMPPRHFLPSPALASPVGSTTGGSQQQPPPNPPLAANAPCSTLFVANLGQFVSEHELKEIFARYEDIFTHALNLRCLVNCTLRTTRWWWWWWWIDYYGWCVMRSKEHSCINSSTVTNYYRYLAMNCVSTLLLWFSGNRSVGYAIIVYLPPHSSPCQLSHYAGAYLLCSRDKRRDGRSVVEWMVKYLSQL